MVGLGGSTLDSVDTCDIAAAVSGARRIGRVVGRRSSSSVGVGGIDLGSVKGPWSTAGADGSGAAAPFASQPPSANGEASGYSGRTSGEAMVGDELLLSGGLTAVRALLDLLGAGEVEYKF